MTATIEFMLSPQCKEAIRVGKEFQALTKLGVKFGAKRTLKYLEYQKLIKDMDKAEIAYIVDTVLRDKPE